jgi:VanZ family protein
MKSLLLSPIHPEGQRLRRQIAIGLTIGLSIVIAALTLTPGTSLPSVPGSDKLHHVLAFAALMFPCAFVYPKSLPWVLSGSLMFGGSIELIQPSVGRSGEWSDFFADAVGIAAGTIIGLTLRFVLKKWLSLQPSQKTIA